MKNKRTWIVIVLAVSFLIFKFAFHEKPLTGNLTENPASPLAAPLSSAPNPAASPSPITQEKKIFIPARENTLEAESPKLEDVRKEAAQNPHQTPPSILKFAADLGEKMKLAIQSEANAEKLYSELEKCALDIPKSTYTSTPRTLCYSDATELAQKYPSLSPNLDNLKRGLDPDTLKRFNQFQKAMEKPNGTNTR